MRKSTRKPNNLLENRSKRVSDNCRWKRRKNSHKTWKQESPKWLIKLLNGYQEVLSVIPFSLTAHFIDPQKTSENNVLRGFRLEHWLKKWVNSHNFRLMRAGKMKQPGYYEILLFTIFFLFSVKKFFSVLLTV